MSEIKLLKLIKNTSGKYKMTAVVFDVSTQQESRVNFGARGYNDYTIYYKNFNIIFKIKCCKGFTYQNKLINNYNTHILIYNIL